MNEKLNVEKYQALAYGSPAGKRLETLVHERWNEWKRIVEDSTWIRRWVNSKYYMMELSSATNTSEGLKPTPSTYTDGQFGCHGVAQIIYTNSVWGYGVQGDLWLRNPLEAMRYVYVLQGHETPASAGMSKVPWDPQYLVEGIYMPREFADLDRWLESLWTLASSSKKYTH